MTWLFRFDDYFLQFWQKVCSSPSRYAISPPPHTQPASKERTLSVATFAFNPPNAQTKFYAHAQLANQTMPDSRLAFYHQG